MKWTIEKLQKEALKYKTRVDFQKDSPRAYDAAHGRKLLDDICKHMLPSRSKPWTYEELREEALKYTRRGDFKRGNPAAYAAAWKRCVLDDICISMQPRSNEPYTYEELRFEALKYGSRGDFIENNVSAYKAAVRLKILDGICSHMKPSRGSSKAERELFSIIKGIYPNAKKLRDMRVKIEGKPYIKGFDIDILVGNLGIEFDGRHHHTFEYMRNQKSRIKWSDDDVRNYHQLKDAWFATKGIKILHIKEKDWIKDKEACIKRCLDFLST